MYCFYNSNFKAAYLGKKKSTARLCNIGIKLLDSLRSTAAKELKASERFNPPSNIKDLADMASPIVSLGNQTGEGLSLIHI